MKIFLLFAFLIGSQWNASATTIEWVSEYDVAIDQSKESGKPVFVDCFADWCMWCHKMEQEVYSDPKFVQFLQNYIPLRLDIEDGSEGTRWAQHYGVETLPTLLVIDSNGLLLNRIGGYMNTAELLADLKAIQDLVDKERTNPNDWESIQTLGEEYLFRDMNQEAEMKFSRILSAPVNDTKKESAYFSLALSQYYQQKNQAALKTLQDYLQIFVEGRSTEDVLLLLSQIYLEMDQPDLARQVLQQFLKAFPDSDNVPRVRKVLSELR